MIPRARNTDPISSHIAAKNAHGNKAETLRRNIGLALFFMSDGMTARELAKFMDEDYYDIQRRLSETEGIRKTGEMRDGAMVWAWVGE